MLRAWYAEYSSCYRDGYRLRWRHCGLQRWDVDIYLLSSWLNTSQRYVFLWARSSCFTKIFQLSRTMISTIREYVFRSLIPTQLKVFPSSYSISLFTCLSRALRQIPRTPRLDRLGLKFGKIPRCSRMEHWSSLLRVRHPSFDAVVFSRFVDSYRLLYFYDPQSSAKWAIPGSGWTSMSIAIWSHREYLISLQLSRLLSTWLQHLVVPSST